MTEALKAEASSLLMTCRLLCPSMLQRIIYLLTLIPCAVLCCAVLCCAVLCCAGGHFIINGSDHDNNSVFDTGNGRAKGNVQVTFDILTRLLVASP